MASELWTRQFGTGRYEDVAGIVVDPSSIFVAGSQVVGSIQFPARTVDRAFLTKLEKAAVTASPSETRIRNECVLSAGNYVGGAVSPGEIVTIFGQTLGPSQPVSATIIEGRPVDATLAETRVLFDGVAAPLLYVSSGQVSAIVPNGVASRASVEIQVEYRGVLSNAVILPVLKMHPGIFQPRLVRLGGGAKRGWNRQLAREPRPSRLHRGDFLHGRGRDRTGGCGRSSRRQFSAQVEDVGAGGRYRHGIWRL